MGYVPKYSKGLADLFHAYPTVCKLCNIWSHIQNYFDNLRYHTFVLHFYIQSCFKKSPINSGNNSDEDKQDSYPQDFIHLIPYTCI